jgi:peptidoglycan/xylan/chitin deacetylase (PgdA/CDA1 family)
VIYLTFDDGPGAYTGQLLDVLKKYNVKATFFVTCKGDDSLIKREYDEGHTVALYTCSHNYSQIYASYNAYFKDLDQVKARVKRITGYDANIIRFPGGTSNGVSPNISMKSLAKQVLDKGYYYFDWNVSSGDAGGQTTSYGVYYAVINSLKSGSSVVLQHDIKKFSVEAVERIIQYGQANGYTFERLREDSPKIRHGAGH